jgi:hypothetical protein
MNVVEFDFHVAFQLFNSLSQVVRVEVVSAGSDTKGTHDHDVDGECLLAF